PSAGRRPSDISTTERRLASMRMSVRPRRRPRRRSGPKVDAYQASRSQVTLLRGRKRTPFGWRAVNAVSAVTLRSSVPWGSIFVRTFVRYDQRPIELGGPSHKYGGIRPPMHPASLRCSSLRYSRYPSVVAPCQTGASAPSLRRHIYETDH